jgi:hypothetical protein
VLFDYRVEALLALAHQFDVPALFSLIEEVASDEPSCRLALLMDPLRWLLVCDGELPALPAGPQPAACALAGQARPAQQLATCESGNNITN